MYSTNIDIVEFSVAGCASARMKSPINHFHFQQFDFSSHLANKKEGFVGRKWFFWELENIFDTNRRTAGVLITGDPGFGKSALMSQLICSRYSSLPIHQNIIGFHLCDYSNNQTRNGTKFVRNLVDQIAGRMPDYSEYILQDELIRWELDHHCHEDATGCFVNSILGPLRVLQSPNELKYIVVDGLDQCFEGDKKSEIIEILKNKILQFPKWLKVILTSRNTSMVTKTIPQVVKRMPLYANDERNIKDIHLYMSRLISQNSSFIDRLGTAMDFSSRTNDNKIFMNDVIMRAAGNFFDVLKIMRRIRDAAEMVDTLPRNLFDAYKNHFDRQFRDGFGPFNCIFEVLLSMGSPLQLSEVEEILSTEYEVKDVHQLIEKVSAFLGFHDGTVRIFHQSFAEWLVNQSDVILLNKTRAHQNIAKFQLHKMAERNTNVTIGEVIQLLMHILAGNTLEKHESSIDLFNITQIREPRTDQSILHHLATKPRPFLPVLKFLIPKFKTIDIPDARKKTPAFYAASEGFVENLRYFINGGADVNSFMKGFKTLDPFQNVVFNKGIEEYSLIHAAAAKGHYDVVNLLIESNVSFQESRQNFPTPFHLAAGNGHLSLLRLFYNHGAKFDVITLHHAAARNHLDIVEFLLTTVGVRDVCLQCTCKPEHDSIFSAEDVHLYFCETALHAAVSRRYMDVVKMLLAYGKESLECTHHSGKTVLMDAVEKNDFEMVALLLKNGANITTQFCNKVPKQRKSIMCSQYSMFKEKFMYTVYCTDHN